jgi:hypothetical protein
MVVANAWPELLLVGYDLAAQRQKPEMKTAPIAGSRLNFGGASQIRTVDLRIKSPLLYQLS